MRPRHHHGSRFHSIGLVRPCLVVLTLLAPGAGPAAAQTGPAPPDSGATVRATVSESYLWERGSGTAEAWRTVWWRGRLLGLGSDSLRIAAEDGDVLSAPLANVAKIEMLAGREPIGLVKGGGIGAGIGALGLGIAGAATCEDDFVFSKGECTAMSFLGGAVLGGLVGGLLGLVIDGDRWVPVTFGR